MKKAVVLTTHSFFDNHIKVGMEYISLGLSRNGWKTDHISVFSSPFDIIGRRRRERFFRVWVKRQDKKGFDVAPNLKEYATKAIFPANRLIMRYNWQKTSYALFFPKNIREKHYDVCIFDVTPSLPLLSYINADNYVFRLNDVPTGFRYSISPVSLKLLKEFLSNREKKYIWAVSRPLLDYASRSYPDIPAELIPNGINSRLFKSIAVANGKKARSRRAIFIGAIDEWVDQEMIDKVAKMLPEWQFDFYGPQHEKWSIEATNARYLGTRVYTMLPEIMSHYSVGLIPFKASSDLARAVDRPLKFYEYVGAGLGIVATGIDSLKRGIDSWGSFALTPEEFAAALEKENNRDIERERPFREKFIQDNSWESITRKMSDLLESYCK